MLIGGDYISNDVLTLGPCFSEFGYIHVRYALIGRNLTVVTASHRACFRRSDRGMRREGRENLVPRVLSYPPYGARERELSLSRSAGRVGENPGNEVEEESEKKTKEEKRASEREGNLPSLSPLPHPLVVVVFFFCSHLGYLWPHEPVTDLSMANFNGQACHNISLVSVRGCRWSRACIVPQQHLIVREGVYLIIYAHEVKDTDCIA